MFRGKRLAAGAQSLPQFTVLIGNDPCTNRFLPDPNGSFHVFPPSEPMGSMFLGSIYLDLGDNAQAEHCFNRSVNLFPQGNPFASGLLEPLYMQRGDEAKALEYGRKNITFNPTGVHTLAHLRNHDLRTGRYGEARDRYVRSYPELLTADKPTIDDSNFDAAIDLALVLARTGEQERADLLLDRSLLVLRTIPRLGAGG